MDSDDDDIFCYTPLSRNRSLSQTQKIKPSSSFYASQPVSKSKKPSKKQNSSIFKPPISGPPKSKKVKNELITKDTEVCPLCQMPWSAIGINGKRTVHSNKCSAVDFSGKKDCQNGVECQEYNERHYLTVNHFAWAKARANECDSVPKTGIFAFPGPSGWKPKAKKFDDDFNSTPSSGEINIIEGANRSAEIFNLSDDDDDSLPDLSMPDANCNLSNDEVPDLDIGSLYRRKSERNVDSDQLTQNNKPSDYEHWNDDIKTEIFSPIKQNDRLFRKEKSKHNMSPPPPPPVFNKSNRKTLPNSHLSSFTSVNDQETELFPSAKIKEEQCKIDDIDKTDIFPLRNKINPQNNQSDINDMATDIFPSRNHRINPQNNQNDNDDMATDIFPSRNQINPQNDQSNVSDMATNIFPSRKTLKFKEKLHNNVDEDETDIFTLKKVQIIKEESHDIDEIQTDVFPSRNHLSDDDSGDDQEEFHKTLQVNFVDSEDILQHNETYFNKDTNANKESEMPQSDDTCKEKSNKREFVNEKKNSESETDLDEYFSDNSESLLKNNEQELENTVLVEERDDMVAAVHLNCDTTAEAGIDDKEKEVHETVVNDNVVISEGESSSDDEFSKLVDEALDKYLGKRVIQPKCFHLHLHFNENKSETSPQKNDGQRSILNYFKPQNGQASSSVEKTKSKCIHCEQDNRKKSDKVAGGQAWKELMSKMQSNSKKSHPKVDKELNNKKPSNYQNSYYGGGSRSCPFYKYIPDTNIVVDAFSYGDVPGVEGYFLTHFHYDHYRGLTKKFNKVIYCSHITAKLLKVRLGIPSQYLHALPMDEPCTVCNVEVTLLDANHCPGSVMLLFKLPNGKTVLHVGDFRAHQKMESHPALSNCFIDTLFLDTTYCNPVYDFPSQEEVINKCVSVAVSHVKENPKTLLVVGSYTIGKERVFRAIASVLDCFIWASNDKQKTLGCIEDEFISSKLISDKYEARIHVVPMKTINPKQLSEYVNQLSPKYNAAVALRPTGWEHENGPDALENLVPRKCGNVMIYGIPYSEHSSYNELERFVKFTHPRKIIPTVNVGNPQARKSMENEFAKWLK